MMGIFFAVIIWVTGPASFSWAQDEPAFRQRSPELRLSMRDAMQAAIEKNPTVQIFKERVTQAEERAFTRLGAMLPNLSARVSGARRRFFLGAFGGLAAGVSPPIDFYESRVAVTQNLFSLSLIQRWRAARTNIEVAGLDSETRKMDTMALVALAYLEALRVKKSVKARLAGVKLNHELLRLAMERKSVGMATQLDVTRAKVQLENEKQRLLVAKNDFGSAKLNLSRGIGFSFDVKLILTDKLKLVPVTHQSVDEALQVAREHRVELKAQKKRKRLAELTLSSVVMERVPSLSGTGDVGVIGNQPGNALTTNNVQVLLSVPLFDGGQREGRISEQRSVVRLEALRTKDVEKQIGLEVRDAMLTLKSTQQQVAVAKEGLRLSFQELYLAKQRFSVGLATNIEVTDAQTRVAQARDNLIEALFNFNASRVDLARAQGRLEDL
ncbi:MAG: TolC family protein [Nitrospira sp. SB0677_bin_15]|nr:TolC family protein [Nitrospira sp. SB0667_bin_9]MYD30812.1 TolC family protein [Nitrospira sp. SB0661_bin_20]MYG40502.1 TolC family protein [Nitrospira sp. SB0677_bin_15]MYJ22396.1 TolC family protein [Nitrospira sp. SB0673_bin_12]